jgi:hypothetical protein
MNKIFIVHADIGAAKNIVKNLCLLDERIHFPVPLQGLSRLDFLLKFLYPLDYTDWFSCEYTLKNYTAHGIEMDIGDVRSGGLIPLNTKLLHILADQHFILDLMDHGTAMELTTQPHCLVLGIMPYSTLGLNWQIRAYIMKYGAERMFNFTFPNTHSIDLFKERYGIGTWVDVNLTNFYDMVRQRRLKLRNSKIPVIPLECIIWPSRWEELFTRLDHFFNISIPREQAVKLITQWFSLHWSTETTNDWEHSNIFLPNRDIDVMKKLQLCEDFQ